METLRANRRRQQRCGVLSAAKERAPGRQARCWRHVDSVGNLTRGALVDFSGGVEGGQVGAIGETSMRRIQCGRVAYYDGSTELAVGPELNTPSDSHILRVRPGLLGREIDQNRRVNGKSPPAVGNACAVNYCWDVSPN
jgi:hypothetical protein